MKDIIQNIRDLINKKNKTLSDVARGVGVSRQTIYNIFNGQQRMTIDL
jgi:transcriptional regulator with XRE-family HTH domain